MSLVLGIDPGTHKCGYAVLASIGANALELGITPFDELSVVVADVLSRHKIEAIAMGSGTRGHDIADRLRNFGIPIVTVDEHETTLRARARYFAAHPPTGWRRLIPRGLLLPPCPIDDFAAVLIAERYLQQREGSDRGGVS
ncbi:MAG TPA: hypothetical protein VGZ00_13275 [Candidatus Baltobacteraceae bacterium]|jgi:RNase H-fold protein (predicted Holliday junction resolvase)|nr:hypothetical protein [Candidatus Baltobacteraceae bacterium]